MFINFAVSESQNLGFQKLHREEDTRAAISLY